MSKIIVSVQARMASSRLPNKVAFDLGGKPTFVQIMERAKEYIPDADGYFVSTTFDAVDDPLALLAKAYGYEVFRYTEHKGIRHREFFRHLGLKDDDIAVPLSGDSPFVFCEHLPFAVAKSRETGRRSIAFLEDHTMIWATGVAASYPIRYYRQAISDDLRIAFGHHHYSTHHQPATFIKFPDKFYESWPWAPLFLDYPTEGMLIKVIYNLLYEGKPIDIWRVRKLLFDRPYLAGLVPADVKIADHYYPHGPQGYVQEVQNTTDSTTVEWKGGDEIRTENQGQKQNHQWGKGRKSCLDE